MMRQPVNLVPLKLLFSSFVFLFLAFNALGASPVELLPQSITLPATASVETSLFIDIDGDGLLDLLVIDRIEKKLFKYNQRPTGFTNSPDQIIPLPPQTGWVSACDVDAHPGLELLISTAKGVYYCEQNAGLIESDRHLLIEASQIFTNKDYPILSALAPNTAGTNATIPVFSSGVVVPYRQSSAAGWSPGPSLPLEINQTTSSTTLGLWDDPWTLGGQSAHRLTIQKLFRAKKEHQSEVGPENQSISRLIGEMKKKSEENAYASPPKLSRMDLNGDGQEDLVLSQVSQMNTDVYVFLRGPDRKLPDRPTQVLHCGGFAIPIQSTDDWSPVYDLRGDGVFDLVLVEFDTAFINTGGLINTAISHGLDFAVTIRPFRRGGFVHKPEASVRVTLGVSTEVVHVWPIFIHGDFNGDGRPDLVVRRSDTQWNIFPSTTNGTWFSSQPGMTLSVPFHGNCEIKDLNGDGCSDLIWRESEESRLSIFMSPPRATKGKKT